jgi:4-diphosphocytidyl-2C-methyl-D-erythritol kinase
MMGNDLEPVTRRLFPPFDEALERLRTKVPGLNMTGTGAGLFAVYENEREAATALAAIRDLGYPTWICRPVPAGA